MVQHTLEEGHKDQSVLSHYPFHSPIWLRVVGHLSLPSTTPRIIPSVLPLRAPQHGVTSLIILKSVKKRRSPTSWPCWTGPVSIMVNYRLTKITLHTELSTSHRDRRAPKKLYKDGLKKTLGVCHVDHRRSPHKPKRLTLGATTQIFFISSFKNTLCILKTLSDKRNRGRRSHNTMLSRPDLLWLCLPVPHWPCQLRTCLHLVLTNLYLIFVHESCWYVRKKKKQSVKTNLILDFLLSHVENIGLH